MAAVEEHDLVIAEERLSRHISRSEVEAEEEKETAPGTEAPKLCFRWRRHRGSAPFRGGVFQHPLEFHSSCLVGVKIYVFGGCRTNDPSDRRVYCLDYKQGVWSKIDPKGRSPVPRNAHTTTLVDDKVFLIAGESTLGPERDVYLYDLAGEWWDKCEVKGDRFPSCKGHSADYAEEYQKVIVFQQPAHNPNMNNIFVLDPKYLQWKRVVPKGVPPERCNYHSSYYENSRLYIYGGFGEVQFLNAINVLTLTKTTYTWTRLRDMNAPPGRTFATLTASEDKLLVIGGLGGYESCNLIEVYDMVSQCWVMPESTGSSTQIITNGNPPSKDESALHSHSVIHSDKLLLISSAKRRENDYYELSTVYK